MPIGVRVPSLGSSNGSLSPLGSPLRTSPGLDRTGGAVDGVNRVATGALLGLYAAIVGVGALSAADWGGLARADWAAACRGRVDQAGDVGTTLIEFLRD